MTGVLTQKPRTTINSTHHTRPITFPHPLTKHGNLEVSANDAGGEASTEFVAGLPPEMFR